VTLPQPPAPPTTCYRHPNREAGRSCTRCGKVACSECLVQVTVGSHCVDCARASRPAASVRVRDRWAAQQMPITMALIGLNTVVFALMAMADTNTLAGQSTSWHAQLGLNRTFLAVTDDWHRLVTSAFIHFGPFHLLMNMFLLYQLGQLLERSVGSLRFAALYVAGLFSGAAGVLLLDGTGITITGGASGAVFGLLAAAAVGLQRQGVNVFSTGIGSTLLINLVLTFSLDGISIGGHVGGAIGGALAGLVTLAPRWKPVSAKQRLLAPLAIAVVMIIASIAITKAGPIDDFCERARAACEREIDNL
jgi:membrane associated rhomboid family serine protease